MAEQPAAVAPLLVVACGNPSRGDDALGPALVERIESLLVDEIRAGALEVLTDFQLQVEYALDLIGREQVVFVDAGLACAAPFEWTAVEAMRDATFSTHALSPAAVLAAYRDATGRDPPPSHSLCIRGCSFELGEPLSAQAHAHLEAALAFLAGWTRRRAGAGAVRHA